MKRRLLLAAVLGLSLTAGTALAASPARPAEWATSVSDGGVDNLYLIEPGLFRSAAPSSTGFEKLAARGVKAILDLRGRSEDKQVAGSAALKLFHVPMSAWGLHDDRVLEALRILTDPSNRPLLVHCQHGADRTGAIVALYRIVVQGWSKEAAINEMNLGGYHHNSFFHNLDQYVLAADIARLRTELGIVRTESGIVATASGGTPAGLLITAIPLAQATKAAQ